MANLNNVQGFAYFPSIVYRDEHPEWVDSLLEKIKPFFIDKNVSNEFYQTNNLKDKISFFEQYLIEFGKEVLISQGYDMERYELFVSALWGQKIKGFASTNVHVHKNSQLCGWFFLETPIKGSYPIYYDTRNNKQMIELDSLLSTEVTNATSSIHFNNIVPGTVLLSNSWMQHQLTPNFSEFPTTSLHFIISHKDKTCSM